MFRVVLEILFHLLLVLPIIIFTLKKKELINVLLVFMIYSILHKIMLWLPLEYKEFSFDGNWNWSGKLYAILFSVVFLLFYRKYPMKDYFLTFKQKHTFLKKGIFIIGFILLVQLILAFYSMSRSLNFETLLFQLSMPGIDEEIMRGINLGLLSKILDSKTFIFSPAVWVTGILFGFAHGLFITQDFGIMFKLPSFLRTMIYGLIWGWITVKSGSIMLALLSHNLGNGLTKLLSMIK